MRRLTLDSCGADESCTLTLRVSGYADEGRVGAIGSVYLLTLRMAAKRPVRDHATDGGCEGRVVALDDRAGNQATADELGHGKDSVRKGAQGRC